MIRFLPFKGLIPAPERISDVAIRSTDFSTENEILKELEQNELAFLHVTQSNLMYPDRVIEDEDYFKHSVDYVRSLMTEGHLIQDQENCYYLYRQSSYSGTFVGIIGLSDIADYQKDKIKRHENTRVSREKWVARLVKETKVVGEPVLLVHADHPDIQDAIGNTIVKEPDIKFVARNNSIHEIWRFSGEVAEHIREVFEQISAVYIMDGHHRSASFARLYQETNDEKYRYFLGMMLSSFNIKIWPFHRLIKLSDRSVEEFMEQVQAIFTVEKSENNLPVIPEHKGTFGLYARGSWYHMHSNGSREELDVTILEKNLLGPVLNITDTRSDDRLEYLRGNHTIEWLQNHTDKDQSQVLITLYPCGFDDIQRISDNNEIMPPKSTYIEPKGRSGMIIQKLES